MIKNIFVLIIFLRLIPVFVLRKLWVFESLSRYMLIFSMLSFLTDVVCLILVNQKLETIIVVTIFTVVQPILIFFILLYGCSFNRKQIFVIGSLNCLICISILYFLFVDSGEFLQSVIWGISNFLLSIECLYGMFKIAVGVKITSPKFPIHILPILGLFIYTSFSLVPLASHFIQLTSNDKLISAQLYFVFVVSGNFFRDLFFALYGFFINSREKIVR